MLSSDATENFGAPAQSASANLEGARRLNATRGGAMLTVVKLLSVAPWTWRGGTGLEEEEEEAEEEVARKAVMTPTG